MHERQDLLELWWGPWGPTAINSYLTYRYVLEMRVVEDAVLVTSGNQTEENDVNSSFATVRQMDWKPIYNGTGKFKCKLLISSFFKGYIS